MILRLLTALVGALVVTASLLLGMDAVTSVFRERDTGRFFRIMDVLPSQDDGRPERPAPARRQPELENPGFTADEAAGPLEPPARPVPGSDLAPPAPAIERPEVAAPETDRSAADSPAPEQAQPD